MLRRLYPSLRLFPDSLSRLFPAAPVTSAVAENTDKRRVPFEVGPPEAPLLALFVLADPADTIRAERLTPAEACMEIIANSFSFDRNDPAEARGRLARAADLARLLPVFDLHYPRDYAALSDVHACIFETLGLAPPLLKALADVGYETPSPIWTTIGTTVGSLNTVRSRFQ